MKIKIFKVQNKQRKFGSAQDYIAVIDATGTRRLFTQDVWADAEVRAAMNPEDFKRPSLWARLFRK